MKRVFSTILVVALFLLLALPYFLLAEYNNRIKELETQVIMLQKEDEKIEKQTRLNTQDIEILNNIIYEKDFVKMLD